MTTREDVMEGIERLVLQDTRVWSPFLGRKIMDYLDSNDVVIVKDWRFVDKFAVESLRKEIEHG